MEGVHVILGQPHGYCISLSVKDRAISSDGILLWENKLPWDEAFVFCLGKDEAFLAS
jgi:hypothetical protein